MGWLKSFLIQTGINALLAALQDPVVRPTVKGICVKVVQAIFMAFPNDPDFK